MDQPSSQASDGTMHEGVAQPTPVRNLALLSRLTASAPPITCALYCVYITVRPHIFLQRTCVCAMNLDLHKVFFAAHNTLLYIAMTSNHRLTRTDIYSA